MTPAISDFFQRLNQRGHDPHLEKVHGTIRLDIRDGPNVDQWLLTVENGDVRVSKDARQAANTVITADLAYFDRVVRGEVHPAAAMLRGEVLIRGDWALAVMLQRIFPSPPGTRGPRLIPHRERP